LDAPSAQGWRGRLRHTAQRRSLHPAWRRAGDHDQRYRCASRAAAIPTWLQTFLDRLAADDLSATTRRGYRYDLLQFIAWYAGLNNAPPELARLTEHDLITWRQHMMTQGGLQAASMARTNEKAFGYA
jgi:Phage integrase, N-terminal SAM-like domain